MATNDLPAGSRGGNPAPRFRPPPGLHSRPKPAGRMIEKDEDDTMKTLYEVAREQGPLLTIIEEGHDGGCGLLTFSGTQPLRFVASWGMGWEHVSVSLPNRCPTWEELHFVKRAWWRGGETVIQYHPAETEYVNYHPFCLHLWRPIGQEVPTPPAWMVGPPEKPTPATRKPT